MDAVRRPGAEAVLEFYRKQLTDGFWYTDRLQHGGDESGSTSHDHLHVSPACIGLVLAERGDGGKEVAAELKRLLIQWMRSWLIDCALHRSTRKLGQSGGIRFPAVDRGGARWQGEVDQTETRARTAAFLLDGTRPPKGVDAPEALDLTAMWALQRVSPETLAAIRKGIAGVDKAKLPLGELPRTHNPYRLTYWPTGHVGCWVTTNDMSGPAKWTVSSPKGVSYYAREGATVDAPKGATVIDYPTATQAKEAA